MLVDTEGLDKEVISVINKSQNYSCEESLGFECCLVRIHTSGILGNCTCMYIAKKYNLLR